jgi:Holliday junction resolvasome RuvABC endonuclease subunit
MEQIKKLISEQKDRKEEVMDMINTLQKIQKQKLQKDDRDSLEVTLRDLENELTLRTSFISDLEDLL